MITDMKYNLLTRVQAIFEFLEKESQPIFKSQLREVGLDSKSAQKYIDTIEFIQSQPKLIVTKTKNNVIIELEKKDKNA